MNHKEKQIVVMSVQNKPGVMNKVLSLCRRRRYNIQSVSSGATNQEGIHNITLVFPLLDEEKMKQIVNQINKIIEVISVEIVDEDEVIDREMALLVVKNRKIAESLVRQGRRYDVKIVLDIKDGVVLQITGRLGDVDRVLALVDMKKDVVKMVKNGLVALKI